MDLLMYFSHYGTTLLPYRSLCHLTGDRLLPLWVQESNGSAAAEEGGAWCQPVKKLQAGVKLTIPLLSSDLSLDKHVSSVCATCFYWLRQLRRVRRSLDDESTKTLVHAFVTARVDYCNMVFAGAPRSVTMTVDCRSCYMTTCTGSMWQIESGSSSPSQSTGVCTTRRQSTWQTAVSLSRISLVVSTPSPAGCTALSTINTRPSGVLCR